MAVMRVFWGMALVPELDSIYHRIRAAPSCMLPGHHVGWDMLEEKQNEAIRAHVCHHVSETQINNFVETYPFIETVISHIRREHGREPNSSSHQKDSSADVATLVAHFKQVVGSNWAQATRQNTSCHIISGEGAGRKMAPWKEVEYYMSRSGDDAPHKQVLKHVDKLTPFFKWR